MISALDYTVVLDEYNLQLTVDGASLFTTSATQFDQLDDLLCTCVSCGSFCTKDKCSWIEIHLRMCLDLVVQIDHMQDVKKLTFVLMKTFDLDIINTVCIDLFTCVGFDKLRTSLLCILLDLKDICKNVLISLEAKHLVKLKGILAEADHDQE